MIQGFGEEALRIRREGTGLDETPDSDAEGLDTQADVMLATTCWSLHGVRWDETGLGCRRQ